MEKKIRKNFLNTSCHTSAQWNQDFVQYVRGPVMYVQVLA